MSSEDKESKKSIVRMTKTSGNHDLVTNETDSGGLHGCHRFLNEIGVESSDPCVFNSTDDTDERMGRFIEERKEHSFDSRETWSLDYTLATWLYEHLMFYKEIADETTDLSFHRFDVPRVSFTNTGVMQTEIVEMSEGEAIDLACSYLRKSIRETSFASHSSEYTQAALRVVAQILPSLWW